MIIVKSIKEQTFNYEIFNFRCPVIYKILSKRNFLCKTACITFATLNYTCYSNFFYPNLFKRFLPEEKKNKRKSRLTKSRRDKTILFTKSGANRLEQLISIGCSKVWRGSRDRRSGALDRSVSRAEIVHRGCRWLYAGFLRTGGWVMVVPISSVHSLLRYPSRATIFRWVTPMVPETRGHFAYWILVLRASSFRPCVEKNLFKVSWIFFLFF